MSRYSLQVCTIAAGLAPPANQPLSPETAETLVRAMDRIGCVPRLADTVPLLAAA